MIDQLFVYATATVILGLIVASMIRKTFDPFAPVWLFLAGYFQIYVVQALSYREYSLRMRGMELVTQANARALWALAWFLLVYFSGAGRKVASKLPRPPSHWSPGFVGVVSPVMIVWGLICSGIVLTGGASSAQEVTAEENLLRQFPIMMLAAGILIIVTSRAGPSRKPAMTALGVAVALAYVVIWMFNGKRSHSLIGVLTAICAFYVSKRKRPSILVLAATGFVGAMVVTLSLGWRNNHNYDRSVSGFVQYIGDFKPESILVNLNVKEARDVDPHAGELVSKETEEYCGYLLMLDTVPAKSDYDYGESYLRLYSTYIPRIVWPDKPFYGRKQWVEAWIAGSEFKRDATFTGPAIGVLGATQLNGGALGTVIVLAVLAVLIRTSYDYFRLHESAPWAQAWWALTYYNAWLMTVNDDPFVWFYYIYGHTILPPLALLWIYHKMTAPRDLPA